MKVCAQCHNEAPDQANFCPECGAFLAQAAAEPSAPAAPDWDWDLTPAAPALDFDLSPPTSTERPNT